MTFPTNNLPTQSKYWGREVEKKITNLESSLRSSEINNTTRDSQLSVTAGQALIASNQAIAAAAEASAAATQAGQAIDSILDLGSPGGPTINASNITAGTLTGITVQTGSSGTRSKLSGSNIEFFSSLYNSGASRVGYIQGDDGGDAGLYVISDQGSIALDAVNITLSGDATVTGELSVGGSLGVTGAFSPGSISTGAIEASSLVASGTVSGSTISGATVTASGTVSGSTVSGSTVSASNFSGTVNTSIAGNTTASFAGNVFINTSGNMFRSTSTSSREAKENIVPFDFDADSFIAVNPVTFNYKPDAVSSLEESEISQLGFIVEDFEEAGLGEHLVIPANELDSYKSLRYDKLYMYLHKVVQKQQATIQNLTARIEALESR